MLRGRESFEGMMEAVLSERWTEDFEVVDAYGREKVALLLGKRRE